MSCTSALCKSWDVLQGCQQLRTLELGQECLGKQSNELVTELLAKDVPEQLLDSLPALDFELQKTVASLFVAIFEVGAANGSSNPFSKYVQRRPQLLLELLKGCGCQATGLHCGSILRCFARDARLVTCLFEQGALVKLTGLAMHQSFEISSDAFASLRELLFLHKEVVAEYLEVHGEDFFAQYKPLLESTEYTVQRQALKLLGLILLDGAFMDAMSDYVQNVEFLKIHMNLLLSASVRIQKDNFHIFKLFVANPYKPDCVAKTLRKNRTGLVRLLSTSFKNVEDDAAFVQDLTFVTQTLEALGGADVVKPSHGCKPCTS